VRRPYDLTACHLGYLAAVKARYLADDGQGREAAELLLDLGQFGRDASIGSTYRRGFGWHGVDSDQ
jgi:hypothetical protein